MYKAQKGCDVPNKEDTLGHHHKHLRHHLLLPHRADDVLLTKQEIVVLPLVLIVQDIKTHEEFILAVSFHFVHEVQDLLLFYLGFDVGDSPGPRWESD